MLHAGQMHRTALADREAVLPAEQFSQDGAHGHASGEGVVVGPHDVPECGFDGPWPRERWLVPFTKS